MSNGYPSVFKNTLIYLLGNLGSKFISFLMLPLYTHYLSTGEFGYFDIISVVITLIVPVISFQVSDGVYRYLLDEKSRLNQSKVIPNTLKITLTNLLIFNAIFLCSFWFINIKYGTLILVSVNAALLSGLWQQIARGYQKNILYSVSGVIYTIAVVISNIIFIVFFKWKIEALLISNIIGSIVSIIYIELKIGIIRNTNFRLIDKSLQKKIIRYSLPLIPNTICWWGIMASNRFIIKYFLGVNANGIFAVANRFSTLLMLINSMFYLAWQENAILSYSVKDRDKYYSRIFNIYMCVELSAAIILIACSKTMIYYFVDKSFYGAWKYTPFLYLSAVFNSFASFYGTGYLSSMKTKGAFTTTIFSTLLNILLNIILIPVLGLQGAALSMLISFLFLWIIRIEQLKNIFTITINYKVFFSLLAVISIYSCSILLFALNKYLDYILIGASLIIFLFYNNALLKRISQILVKFRI